MARKVPAGYKARRIQIVSPEGYTGLPWANYFKDVEIRLKEIENQGGIDIVIGHENSGCDYDTDYYYAEYFYPMTEDELQRAKARNIQAKAALAAREKKKTNKEREDYERLKQKFENK